MHSGPKVKVKHPKIRDGNGAGGGGFCPLHPRRAGRGQVRRKIRWDEKFRPKLTPVGDRRIRGKPTGNLDSRYFKKIQFLSIFLHKLNT
jgi:hypothetical protein